MKNGTARGKNDKRKMAPARCWNLIGKYSGKKKKEKEEEEVEEKAGSFHLTVKRKKECRRQRLDNGRWADVRMCGCR